MEKLETLQIQKVCDSLILTLQSNICAHDADKIVSDCVETLKKLVGEKGRFIVSNSYAVMRTSGHCEYFRNIEWKEEPTIQE